jgi:phosphoribosylglycinamide formyltransferase-1
LTRKIAILASGGGSNAQKIIEHFKNSEVADVVLLAANKAECGALAIAQEAGIESFVLTRDNFRESSLFTKELQQKQVDFIVLAGFLWLVPASMVQQFPDRIVNIHPALLPKFGGKGMYGMNVHRAVKEANEVESGMTIHFVNEKYDQGDIIFQGSTSLNPTDSPEEIAAKVLKLEHENYSKVIEQVVLGQA